MRLGTGFRKSDIGPTAKVVTTPVEMGQNRSLTRSAGCQLPPATDIPLYRLRSESCTKAVVSRCSKVRERKAELFDHLVGNGEQRRRQGEAEHPGS
jgi:hypothetical protein